MDFTDQISAPHRVALPLLRLLLFMALVAVLWTAKNIVLELLLQVIPAPDSPYFLLLQEVLPNCVQSLGADDPLTLQLRGDLGYFLGEEGKDNEAQLGRLTRYQILRAACGLSLSASICGICGLHLLPETRHRALVV